MSSRLDGDLSFGADFPESDFLEEVRFAFGDFDFAAIREDEDLSRPRLGDDSVFPDDRWDFFMEEEEGFFLGEEELWVEPFLPIENSYKKGKQKIL